MDKWSFQSDTLSSNDYQAKIIETKRNWEWSHMEDQSSPVELWKNRLEKHFQEQLQQKLTKACQLQEKDKQLREMHLELQWHVEKNLLKSAELLLFKHKLQEELLLNESLKQQINILQQQIENHKALVGLFDYFIPQSGKYVTYGSRLIFF